MSRPTHAEARALLADLALDPAIIDPAALDRVAYGESRTETPLVEHIASCAECTLDLEAWRRTHAAVRAALADPHDPEHAMSLANLAADEPTTAPAELRSVVLNRARIGIMEPSAGIEVAGEPARPQLRRPGISPLRRFLPLAAVLAVILAAGGILLDQGARLEQARADAAALEAVTATLDRVLADPAHRIVDLRTVDGSVTGSLSWSSQDIAVLTTALDRPSADRVYRCWIERDGTRSPVGTMSFAGGTAFWMGSLDEWATTTFDAGGTFGISLEPVSGPAGNPAILAADLGG